MNNHTGQTILGALISAAFLALLSLFFSACAGRNASVMEDPVPEAPGHSGNSMIIVKKSQEVVYNGKPQPISFSYTGKEAPGIIYYPSSQARREERRGTTAAPVRAGTYYVRLLGYSDGKNHLLVEEHFVEYRILKCPVKIEAKKTQEAFYNGDPKRVQAKTDPPVLLSYSYYPNRELRETAQRAAAEIAAQKGSGQIPTDAYKGYKRVERAPTEQGTYYVWVYFPGDENYEAAQVNVEFTIYPPKM